MLRRILLILALILAPAVVSMGAEPATVQPPMGTSALPPKMWLRGGVLFDRPDADVGLAPAIMWAGRLEYKGTRSPAVGWLVPDPVLVDVLDGGRIRAHQSDGRVQEGWLPGRNNGVFIKRWELGLYAQVDTPLLRMPEGHPVGRVLTGAFVPVKRLEGQHAVLACGNICDENGALQVSLAALGLKQPSPPQKPVSNAWLQAWGHEVSFSAPPRDRRNVSVSCAPARRLEDSIEGGVPWHRLAVYADGIEVEGWAGEGGPGGRFGCSRKMRRIRPDYPRILDQRGIEVTPPLTEGYQDLAPMDRALEARTRKWFGKTRSLFVPTAKGWAIACQELKTGGGFLTRKYPKGSSAIRSERSIQVNQDNIELGCWETRLRDGRGLVGRCTQYFQVVDVREEEIEVVQGNEVRGYHPDDTEIWYRSRQGCEKRATLSHVSTIGLDDP